MAAASMPSLRRRVLALLLATAGTGLLVAGMVFLTLLVSGSRQAARQDLESLGTVLAYNASPMVAFEDPDGATKLLDGLRQRHDILRADIRWADGSRVASYRRGTRQDNQGEADVSGGLGRLEVTCPIHGAGGIELGTLVIASDQSSLWHQVRWTAGVLLAALVSLGAGIVALSFRVQHLLTGPIRQLAEVAEAVSERNDYSLRAPGQKSRELDALAKAFNGMLAKIQEQDQDLAKHLDQLAKELQERRQAEALLVASETRYRALVENTSDSMFWVQLDAQGDFTIEDVNPAQERLLGKERRDLLGRKIREVLPAELAQRIEGNYRRCLESGHPLSFEEQAELPSGLLVAQTVLLPIPDENGDLRRIIGTSRDITQQRATEESFRQAQKLESLGLLAGGIAHDFNNLLSAMLGNLNLAQSLLLGDCEGAPFLDKVEKTVMRASDLTRQMLAYSGRGRFEVRPVDLNQTVTEIGHLLSVSITKFAKLEFQLQAGLPPILADTSQIQQVVMNLVTNASDAIGERDGSIWIRTLRTTLSDEEVARNFPGQAVMAGDYVLLESADTGCGMSDEVLRKIFDPFFTTKPTGRGLGLSAMLGILRGHGGGIRIQSRPGVGSTFQLFFPCCREVPQAPPPARTRTLEALKGRVLVVDDEREIREAVATSLRMVGLEVVEAADGLQAVARVNEPGVRFDLVVMDLSMPRMDGRKAFLEMQRLHPGLPVLLCSGYDPDEFTGGFEGHQPAGFLHKPYRLAELRERVADILLAEP